MVIHHNSRMRQTNGGKNGHWGHVRMTFNTHPPYCGHPKRLTSSRTKRLEGHELNSVIGTDISHLPFGM
jgi:hypothetical protein